MQGKEEVVSPRSSSDLIVKDIDMETCMRVIKAIKVIDKIQQ